MCSTLMTDAPRARCFFFCFVSGEGFELMLRCLREKKHAAWCAVKVLDFALTDNDTNCQRCVSLSFDFPCSS